MNSFNDVLVKNTDDKALTTFLFPEKFKNFHGKELKIAYNKEKALMKPETIELTHFLRAVESVNNVKFKFIENINRKTLDNNLDWPFSFYKSYSLRRNIHFRTYNQNGFCAYIPKEKIDRKGSFQIPFHRPLEKWVIVSLVTMIASLALLWWIFKVRFLFYFYIA